MASTLERNGVIIRLSFEDVIKNKNSKDNFKLLAGDIITINAHPNIVVITGEVNTPGNYKYYNKRNVRDYIKIAGGLTVNAETREIQVSYPDGTSQQLRPFFPAPKVHDGSIITVGTAEETEPLDKTEFAKELAAIISDFLQIALTLVIISNTSGG